MLIDFADVDENKSPWRFQMWCGSCYEETPPEGSRDHVRGAAQMMRRTRQGIDPPFS
jgi:hypothetical protein